jgi:hypothetical protein
MGWRVWVKGLGAAVIGGGASALSAELSAPDVFTMTRLGAVRLLKVSVVAAVLNAAAYLKQSPLPAGDRAERGGI